MKAIDRRTAIWERSVACWLQRHVKQEMARTCGGLSWKSDRFDAGFGGLRKICGTLSIPDKLVRRPDERPRGAGSEQGDRRCV
ncbi:hypothetical protein LZK98_16885 [Sphingomonas cannabina]|uniref:hypothetical protein n=1 Tax=Sphingomonas cannabina TaxID=2899123 RepID=UPI001F24AA50|nr:hypothetical protein [Sphingomonas cannabina]UIJ44711.1 hypothetical protein LZK98_16885 [Sphingomonas cannabina]